MDIPLIIIESGDFVEFKGRGLVEFRKRADKVHPYGVGARRLGESPITARVEFVDGKIQTLRGDLYTPCVNIMISNLRNLIKKYWKRRLFRKVVIYDNRPNVYSDVIFEMKNGKVVENFLPLYGDQFAIPMPNSST
jgi:hypothetical protein